MGFDVLSSGSLGFEDNYINKAWGTKFDDYWAWAKGTMTSATTGQYAAKVTGAQYHSSPSSLAFGDVGGFSGIVQSGIFGIDASKTSTLTFWLKWGGGSQSAGDTNAIEIHSKSGTVVGCFADIYPSTWTKYTLTFTSTSELTILAQVISFH